MVEILAMIVLSVIPILILIGFFEIYLDWVEVEGTKRLIIWYTDTKGRRDYILL